MRKGFTLVELLVVLGLIALGWLWVPALFLPGAGATASRFAEQLAQLHARARMEALTRGVPAAFALSADGRKMAVLLGPANSASEILQTPVAQAVVFDAALSSTSGQPGVFSVASSSNGFWRAWWYDAMGQPASSGGRLIFSAEGSTLNYQIAAAGALLMTPVAQ